MKCCGVSFHRPDFHLKTTQLAAGIALVILAVSSLFFTLGGLGQMAPTVAYGLGAGALMLIPLVVGGVFANKGLYVKDTRDVKLPDPDELTQAILDIRDVTLTDPEALAQAILDCHGNVESSTFTCKVMGEVVNVVQPIDSRIGKLETLYRRYLEAWRESLRSCRENPWASERVTIAADALIKVAYCIGRLTLGEISEVTEKVAGEVESDKPWSDERVLIEAYAYNWSTFFYEPNVYMMLRLGYVAEEGGKIGNKYPSETHGRRFYDDQDICFHWRQLHNSFCEAAQTVLQGFERQEERFVKYATKDESLEMYTHPGMAPTGI